MAHGSTLTLTFETFWEFYIYIFKAIPDKEMWEALKAKIAFYFVCF